MNNHDESDRWQQIQLEEMQLDHITSHSDLLRHAIYSNAMHGSGYDMMNLTPQPTVTYWQGLDLEETYQRNVDDAGTRRKLEQWGWVGSKIRYELNGWGFRSRKCAEFENITDPTLVTLGCSFTFGTGLPGNSIWPQLTADKLGWRLANLATPGHGLTLGARWLLTEGHRLQNPQAIVAYIPPPSRITWIIQYGHSLIADTFSMARYEKYELLVNSMAINGFSSYLYDIAAIKLWAQSRDIPVLIFEGFPCAAPDRGLARDLRHHGESWHAVAANTVLEKLVDNK